MTRTGKIIYFGFWLFFFGGIVNAAPEKQIIQFLADMDDAPPFLIFNGDMPTGGIEYDMELALAKQLKAEAAFIPTPQRRINEFMASGRTDGFCYFTPEWLEVPATWSIPWLKHTDVLVSSGRVPMLMHWGDLKGKHIGTVIGYHYPKIQHTGYIRDDVIDPLRNLDKLKIGRFDYAATDLTTFLYYLSFHNSFKNYNVIKMQDYQLQCGFSLKSKVDIKAVNQAIARMQNDGEIKRIIVKYRPSYPVQISTID
ncbi:MAG: transporter substrate-binding domain-containing protein [Paludibacterium sp.]|uniref:substrate-binding periplasmic protein n=1 Tax=Paludibacterium sp. TaxID=1917523 RepID=UPI0025DFFA1F|nr:transporter substrate-binding domain-containing protein [Paludibacterium sp.]MBV8047498.1 transporter substrate-binding domain-containing protein [Paludibacterium sp.]MBV8646379.1 transporter substrate-binding domain-containing protein [Paludibacterium sp.]